MTLNTWMCLTFGADGDEIVNQGRSRVKSFSQETVAIGQRTPRIGENGPKLRVKVQDARMILRTISPFFIFSNQSLLGGA